MKLITPKLWLEKAKKAIKTKNRAFRRTVAASIAIAIVGVSYAGFSINDINTRAVKVMLSGEEIGIVRTQEDAQQAYNVVKDRIKSTYNMDIVLDKELEFEELNAKDEELTGEKDLEFAIRKRISFNVTAYEVIANGETLGYFRTGKEAIALLNTIKQPYLNEESQQARNAHLENSAFVEDIDIQKVEMDFSELTDIDEAVALVREGKEAMRTHIVEAGESYWTIAKIYNTSVDELINANPDQNPQRLRPGDEVKLFVPEPLVTVVTEENVEYQEATAYEVETREDNTMYKNQKKILVKGVKGVSDILAKEVRHNGILIEKSVISETVVEEPITEVVVKGTKELPKTAAIGSFIVPTRGRLTSPYGMRGRSFHRGIDLANRTGTQIKAADGGRVVFAGYKGTYGYLVEINHENGYITRYAHNSRILVKVGDRVYRGQHIANMGSTGRSTGSHLHFEVLKNGANQNPSRYIY